MSLEMTPSVTVGDNELRRRIDLSLSRALLDREFRKLLLADPTIVVGQHGCTPQQFVELREIRAHDIQDFALQAEALFWPASDGPTRDARQLVAAAW